MNIAKLGTTPAQAQFMISYTSLHGSHHHRTAHFAVQLGKNICFDQPDNFYKNEWNNGRIRNATIVLLHIAVAPF